MESKVIIPPTLPTFGHSTVYVYPTVSPKVVIVPILTCIFGFPVLVLLIICALRYRARKARTTAKKTRMRRDPSALDLPSGPSILASRCSEKEPRTSFKKKKTLVRFKPMPEIDLDTVVEEKSEFDAEVTASDLLTTPEEFVIPEEDTPAASFRAYRYMGPVQTAPVPKSPIRTSHPLIQHLDNVTEEEMETSDFTVEMEDDDEEEDEEEEEGADGGMERPRLESVGSHERKRSGVTAKTEGGKITESSGSSDSDTTACFHLSPKQVTKSPTAVHLALKKLDGVMNRRHSSPVKVNYGHSHPKVSQQRSSGKVNYSYTGEDGTLMPSEKPAPTHPPPVQYTAAEKAAIDYIDRELMPDFSSTPSPRSHSVKTPSRKSQSFCSRRRGESFKHKKQNLSRSISHKLSSSQENVKKADIIEMDVCHGVGEEGRGGGGRALGKSLSVGTTPLTSSRSVYNSRSQNEIHVLKEARENSFGEEERETSPVAKSRELRIELDPKTLCGALSLTNGANTEASNATTTTPAITNAVGNQLEDSPTHHVPAASPIHPRSWSCSVTTYSDTRNDSSDNSVKRSGGTIGLRAARKAWAENRLGDGAYPVLPLKSPERLIGSLGCERAKNATATNGEKHYTNMMNDYALKYRQEDLKYKSHCQTCTITVESDDERSTLV